jgi:hypothetical protein
MDRPHDISRYANALARQAGYGMATEIWYQEIPDNFPQNGYVASHVRYGWRKKSTDEYVPNAYRANFGWKNTYYQQAETVVVLPRSWQIGREVE